MRFFFDIRNGTIVIDDQGLELAGIDAALAEAKRILASMAADIILAGETQRTIDIRDSERVLYSANISVDIWRL